MNSIWKRYKIGLLLLLATGLVITACHHQDDGQLEPEAREKLSGGWVETDSTGSRVDFGVVFHRNGSFFIENANIGSEAQWNLDDHFLTLEFDYQNEPQQIGFQIVELTDTTMQVNTLNGPRYFRKRKYGENSEALILHTQKIIDKTNARLEKYETLIAELPPTELLEARRLTAWHKDKIKKLIATEPDDSGLMSGRSEYYTHDGQLVFIRMPYAGYVFENYRLVLWVDESMNPVQVSEEEIRNRETTLLEDYNKYKYVLGFGNDMPL